MPRSCRARPTDSVGCAPDAPLGKRRGPSPGRHRLLGPGRTWAAVGSAESAPATQGLAPGRGLWQPFPSATAPARTGHLRRGLFTGSLPPPAHPEASKVLPKRKTLSLPLHSQPHRCPASVTGVLGREGLCPHLLLKSSWASKCLARPEGRDYFQHLPAASNPSRTQTRMGGYTAVQPPSAVLRAPKLDVRSQAHL